MITTMSCDRNAPPPRVEVITSVQRRRRWPAAEKIRLIEETMQPGMSVSYVARRAGFAPQSAIQLAAPNARRCPAGEFLGASPSSRRDERHKLSLSNGRVDRTKRHL